LAVGSITIDISLASDGDTINMAAGQVAKALFYGSDRQNNNCVLTLADGTTEDLVFGAKGQDGFNSIRLGIPGHDEGHAWAMAPIFIDDTVGIRLDGSRSDAAYMINVTYVRVE